LRAKKAEVCLYDPLYTTEEIESHGFVPGRLEMNPAAECIILNTAHQEFAALDFKALAGSGVQAVIQGEPLWEAKAVLDAGLTLIEVGKATSS
jgi:UDP-N-acetyl-D-mannosaminuronate dehydrogenase